MKESASKGIEEAPAAPAPGAANDSGENALKRDAPAAASVAFADKRRRVVLRYNSEETPNEQDQDQSMATHKKLIKRCEDAITAGRFVEGHGSLQFWAGQVLDSIRSAALAPEAAGPDHTLQLLKETFGHFIVKALMDAPCFEACEQLAIQFFKQIERRMLKVQCSVRRPHHAAWQPLGGPWPRPSNIGSPRCNGGIPEVPELGDVWTADMDKRGPMNWEASIKETTSTTVPVSHKTKRTNATR